MRRYAIVIEWADSNYSAYAPDLPGCVTTGPDVEETKRRMGEAIRVYLEASAERGYEVAAPTAIVDYVEVESPAALTVQ